MITTVTIYYNDTPEFEEFRGATYWEFNGPTYVQIRVGDTNFWIPHNRIKEVKVSSEIKS